MSATADTRGLKRVCAGCGARYYDFNKRPVKCPGCQTEFSGEIKLKARRGRVPVAEAAPHPAANDENIEQVERADNIVSLEEVDEGKDDDDEDMGIEGGDDLESLEAIDEDLEDDEKLEVVVEKE